jgi:hypothetical protein
MATAMNYWGWACEIGMDTDHNHMYILDKEYCCNICEILKATVTNYKYEDAKL